MLLTLSLLACESSHTDCPIWWQDADGDGYGDDHGAPEVACDERPGWVAGGGDCDDTRSGVHPGAADVCNGRDDDCDGEVDPTAPVYYLDQDLDGFGDPSQPVPSCTAPPDGAPVVAASGDCDDTNEAISPAAAERCNGIDDDCDGSIDVGAITTG